MFRGPRIVYTATLSVGVLCLSCLALYGFGETGVRSAIRATARSTAAVFLVVFCTAAVRRRWPTPLSHWGMRNRRYLGLSAAVSHGYHLLFILGLYAMGSSESTSLLTLLGGSWGFVLLFAMALTSNDASQKWLGLNWRRLHLLGMWSLWIIFAVSYLPQGPTDPVAAAASLGLVAALVLRLWPRA